MDAPCYFHWPDIRLVKEDIWAGCCLHDASGSETVSTPGLSTFPVSCCCIFLSLNLSIWAMMRKTPWIQTLLLHVQSKEAFPMENLFPSRIWLVCDWSRKYRQDLWIRIKHMTFQLRPRHHSRWPNISGLPLKKSFKTQEFMSWKVIEIFLLMKTKSHKKAFI